MLTKIAEFFTVFKRLRDLQQTYIILSEYCEDLKTELESLKTEQDPNKLRAWSLRVREVGKCDCCESTENLTAHHLWDKNTHPTLMYQDENGVCLCSDCHNAFHRTYTAKSQTTPAQYYKFKTKKLGDKILGIKD